MTPPNILLIMADQLPAAALGTYGHPVVRTPNLDRLAEQGVRFERCYCNSPLCGPSRGSLVTGRLPGAIGAYDNANELPASEPTFMHCLRAGGYRTIISGKLHFVGPDQLHGFEERLTTDIYPAGFDWTANWRRGIYPNTGTSVRDLDRSGVCSWSMQLDHDEEAHYRALAKLRDLARDQERPFFLDVSYTHPHDPFFITAPYYDLYSDGEIDLPAAPALPMTDLHEFNRWMQVHHEVDRYPPSPDTVRRARRAFYGMVSYFDAKVGELLDEVRRLGLAENTVVMVTSDHGEMLGEHGMWYKRCFYDWAVRVPFLVAWPGTWAGGRGIQDNVSLVDLFPTLLEVTGVSAIPEIAGKLDGGSLLGLIEGRPSEGPDDVIVEYYGEGAIHPARMLCRGDRKYIHVHGCAPQLYDLGEDPLELNDLADSPEQAEVCRVMRGRLLAGWDAEEMERRVIESQEIRRMLHRALGQGKRAGWDYQPDADSSGAYVRAWDAQETSRRRRFPRMD